MAYDKKGLPLTIHQLYTVPGQSKPLPLSGIDSDGDAVFFDGLNPGDPLYFDPNEIERAGPKIAQEPALDRDGLPLEIGRLYTLDPQADDDELPGIVDGMRNQGAATLERKAPEGPFWAWKDLSSDTPWVVLPKWLVRAPEGAAGIPENTTSESETLSVDNGVPLDPHRVGVAQANGGRQTRRAGRSPARRSSQFPPCGARVKSVHCPDERTRDFRCGQQDPCAEISR